MRALRRPLLLAAFLASAAAALTACDFAGADDLSGRWAGTARFTVDTLLADYNVRLTADYEATFTFRLTDDEGLITGEVEARMDGVRTVHEAGYEPQTLTLEDEIVGLNDVFGTYIEPVLEVDVPDGFYEQDLWTFEVNGRSAKLDRHLVHTIGATLANGDEFTFDLWSEEVFEIRRVADEE